jgi:hypothetical protein
MFEGMLQQCGDKDAKKLISQIRKFQELLDSVTRNLPCKGGSCDGYAMVCDRCTKIMCMNAEWERLKRIIEPEGTKVLSPLLEHCRKVARQVREWPEWKRNLL